MTTVWIAPAEDAIEGPLASDGSRIFIATREQGIRALDPSGEVVWKVDAPSGQIAAGPGLLVLRTPDGQVVSLDPETGSTRWTVATGITGSGPALLDGDHIVIAGEGIAALDAASGHAFWSLPGPPTVTTPPAASGWSILAGEADGTLRCRDRATGASLWTYKTARELAAPPVVDSDRRVLFGTTDRRFLALDVMKGGQRWRWKVGTDVQDRAAIFRDHLLFASYEDVLYSIDRGNGNMAWRAALPSRPISGPVLVGESVLVVCHENDVVGFRAKTGTKLGGLKTPAEIRTPPLVVDDRLYLGLRDRTVIAYRLDMTSALPAAPKASPSPGRGQQQQPQRRR